LNDEWLAGMMYAFKLSSLGDRVSLYEPIQNDERVLGFDSVIDPWGQGFSASSDPDEVCEVVSQPP